MADELRNLTVAGAVAAVPVYDKSQRGGRGDRAPKAAWPSVAAPLQLVFLEGWCLGFRPLPSDADAAAVHPGLAAVNAALRAHEAAMEGRIDAWVVVRVAEPTWVFDWRLQAEVEMRKSGKAGLSDAQVADFVARFMPAYKAYLPVRRADAARRSRASEAALTRHRLGLRCAGVLQGGAHRAAGRAAPGAGHRCLAHAHRRAVSIASGGAAGAGERWGRHALCKAALWQRFRSYPARHIWRHNPTAQLNRRVVALASPQRAVIS